MSVTIETMYKREPENLVDILRISASVFKEADALLMRPHFRLIRWSYYDLLEYAISVAKKLKEMNVQKGDRVLLWAPSSPYWVAAYFGVLLRGGVVVPIHLENTDSFIARVAEETEATIMLKSNTVSLERELSLQMVSIEDVVEAKSDSSDIGGVVVDIEPHDLAQIVYTSGTTGNPKGVMLTHRNLIADVLGVASFIHAKSDDRFLSILPLSHMFELTAGMLFPLHIGASVIYIPRTSSSLISEALKEHHVTKMLAVPQFLSTVMNNIELKVEAEGMTDTFQALRKIARKVPAPVRTLLFSKVHKGFGGEFRTVASGGAPLDAVLEEKWELFGMHVLQGYGSTETSPVISANSYSEHRFASVGKPLPGVEVKINEDGEIFVKGDIVFSGYYKNEEATHAVLDSEGWYHTGDVGHIDTDGFLFIDGRKKYVIIGPSGQNVFPEDIEKELASVEGVRDSVVLGIQNNNKVEIHAVLLLETNAMPGSTIKDANSRLASYQQIQDYSVWHEWDFPRSSTRKPQKEKIRTVVEEKGIHEAGIVVERSSQSDLVRLLGIVFERDPEHISAKTDLVADLGMDSLLRIEVVTKVEETFGVLLKESAIVAGVTVQGLENMVNKGSNTLVEDEHMYTWWQFRPSVARLSPLLELPFKFWFLSHVSIEAYGLDNLKDIDQPCIFMPTHKSMSDSAVVLYSLPDELQRKISHATALDLMKAYPVGTWLAKLIYGAFPFARNEDGHIAHSLKFMGRLLDKGWSVVLYPEGKIAKTEELGEIKKGAGLIATQMGVPVVPVYHEGIEKLVEFGHVFPNKKGKAGIIFGKPMYFHESTSPEEAIVTIRESLLGLKEEYKRISSDNAEENGNVPAHTPQ